jgi:hypothetical protein
MVDCRRNRSIRRSGRVRSVRGHGSDGRLGRVEGCESDHMLDSARVLAMPARPGAQGALSSGVPAQVASPSPGPGSPARVASPGRGVWTNSIPSGGMDGRDHDWRSGTPGTTAIRARPWLRVRGFRVRPRRSPTIQPLRMESDNRGRDAEASAEQEQVRSMSGKQFRVPERESGLRRTPGRLAHSGRFGQRNGTAILGR